MAEASAQWSELVQGPQRARRSIDDELADGELAACELERSLSATATATAENFASARKQIFEGFAIHCIEHKIVNMLSYEARWLRKPQKIATRRARRKLHDGITATAKKAITGRNVFRTK